MGVNNGLTPEPAVSVAICTHDRPRELRRALASVTASQAPPPFEVLVIDSRPGDQQCRLLVEEYAGRIRYFREERPGIGFARQRALCEATAPIVAFIDDDAVADPDWLCRIAGVLDGQPAAGGCTGLVEALALETPAQRLFEANGGFARGHARIELKRGAAGRLRGRSVPDIVMAVSMGSGCNFAVDRQAALAAGGFDGTFGGDRLMPGGEDLDLMWRLLCTGRSLVYEPSARVRHEHRREMAALGRQLAGHQRGLVACLTKAALKTRGRSRPGVWAFLCWRLCKPSLRLLQGLVGRDPLPARMLLWQWWAATTAPVAYLIARRRVRRRWPANGGACSA